MHLVEEAARAITGAAILAGIFVIAPFVGAALLRFVLVNNAASFAGSPREFRLAETIR